MQTARIGTARNAGRKTVEVFLFPQFVTLETAKQESPALFGFLKGQGVELVPTGWNGELENLPTDKPAMVHASAEHMENWRVLGDFCNAHGHICFHQNQHVRHDGRLASATTLHGRAHEFLRRDTIQAAKLRIEIFFSPSSCTADFVKKDNTYLFRFLEHRDVTVEFREWDNRIESLPKDRPVMIQGQLALAVVRYWEQLGAFCKQHGHLGFLNDQLIDSTGVLRSDDELLRGTNRFLEHIM